MGTPDAVEGDGIYQQGSLDVNVHTLKRWERGASTIPAGITELHLCCGSSWPPPSAP